MVNVILFPSSYFDTKRVDEDLQGEYEAVIESGLFEVILFGYDKWFYEGKIILDKKPDREIMAIYRGWMMKPEQYSSFYENLLEKNIRLITTPKAYELFHIFPNIYPKLERDTAKICVYQQGEVIDIESVKAKFTRFMIKDFVKSVKGTKFPQFFDKNITQEQFESWMEVFYQYRGDLNTGGICIKEFLDLKQYDSKSNEYRVFYINHEIASVSRNSGQKEYTPKPPQALIERYKNLDSVFYTIDYAELEDGTWRIIEAGDGEVSGLSEQQDYLAFFQALYQAFESV